MSANLLTLLALQIRLAQYTHILEWIQDIKLGQKGLLLTQLTSNYTLHV